MRNHRRRTEATKLAQERREREDQAPRLRDLCPDLSSLRLEIAEVREGEEDGADHVRRIVVDHAPALFELPCIDRACQSGGHDLTDEVLRALKSKQEQFEGSHTCGGSLGENGCGRVLIYTAIASYRA